MNIQQLNRSGQPMSVFLATALALLLMTGGSWLCSTRLATHKAVTWYKERAAANKAFNETGNSQEYGLLLRLTMLVWLVRNGHSYWMWRSGAWGAILTDSKTGRAQPDRYRTACEYVSEFSSPELQRAYFELDDEPMATWSTQWR